MIGMKISPENQLPATIYEPKCSRKKYAALIDLRIMKMKSSQLLKPLTKGHPYQ